MLKLVRKRRNFVIITSKDLKIALFTIIISKKSNSKSKNGRIVHQRYILNFKRDSNNMNNELGRKITSLTLMAIMFAGGITVAGASFMPMAEMPEAIATHGSSSGTLSVSSTHIMGGAVLGITITDPAIAATDQAITPPSVSLGDNSIDMTQMSDGTWTAYVVDHETSINLQGRNGGESAQS